MSDGGKLTERKPIETLILERAIEVIEAGGEGAVKTHSIAADCGVTAPVLYRVFGNREGLIIAAQAERFRRSYIIGESDVAADLSRRIARCLSRDDVVDAMRWYFNSVMTSDRHDRRLTRLEIIGSAVNRPKLMKAVADTQTAIIEQFAKMFEIPIEHGWVKTSVDSVAIAALGHGIILGRFMQEISGDRIDEDEWNKAAIEVMLHLMFGEVGDY